MLESSRHAPGERVGLLLINLGTPEAPSRSAVKRYLKEFLSDPRVIDIPAWRRRLLLKLVILPFRSGRTAEAYKKIWSDRGSPLLVHGRNLAAKVQERLGRSATVALAMRYGSPSIPETLDRLRAIGIDRIVVFPLYPQYSNAATGSSIARVWEHAASLWNVPAIQVVPPFYDHPLYIEALARLAAPVIEATAPERVLFSFHGLPQRQVSKGDESGAHCLKRPDCCDAIVAVNRNCYRAQCEETARLVGDRLGLTLDQRVVCFQSRLGRARWIEPYTAEMLEFLAREGVKRVVILSPAFVADCLETLEELGIRGETTFLEAGGQVLQLVPGLNATDGWVEAVVAIARATSTWMEGATAGLRESGSPMDRVLKPGFS